MTSRFVVTCTMCLWVSCILTPPALLWAGNDLLLQVSLNANEEEPHEGQKEDSREDILALPASWVFLPGEVENVVSQVSHPPARLPEMIGDVASPPPERKHGC